MTFADVDKLCELEREKKRLETKGINTKEDEIKYKVVCEKYCDLNAEYNHLIKILH